MKLLFIIFIILHISGCYSENIKTLKPIAKLITNHSIAYYFNKDPGVNNPIWGINANAPYGNLLFHQDNTDKSFKAKTCHKIPISDYAHADLYLFGADRLVTCERDLYVKEKKIMCDQPYIVRPSDLPVPILFNHFQPHTKPGREIIKGYYVFFGVSEYSFKITNSNGIDQKCIVVKPNEGYDGTALHIDYPGGCGTSTITWSNSLAKYSYKHAAPVISDAIMDDLKRINIIGVNFCNNDFLDNISATINYKKYAIFSIDHELIILKVDESLSNQESLKISVKIYDEISNSITINPRFYLTTNVTKPSVYGTSTNYSLYGLNRNSTDLISTINITNSNYSISINSTEKSGKIRTFQTKLPSGCGLINVNVTVGNQNLIFKQKYDTVSISSCKIIGTVESKGKVECFGTFNNFIDYYSKNNDFIKFTNIQSKFNFNSVSILSFELKSEHQTSKLLICNEAVYDLTIPPKIIGDLPINKSISFNSKGGNITLIGNHFNQGSINNTYFICNDDDGVTNVTFKVNCLYESYSSSICPFNITGPNDIKCNFIFDGVKINNNSTNNNENQLIIEFDGPTLLNITNQIDLEEGGIITIIGNEFYNNTISNITIGNRECLNSTYFNETTLTCYLPSFDIISTTKNDIQLIQYVHLTTVYGKSDGINLLIYNKYFNDNESQSNYASSNNENNSESSTPINSMSNSEINNESSTLSNTPSNAPSSDSNNESVDPQSNTANKCFTSSSLVFIFIISILFVIVK